MKKDLKELIRKNIISLTPYSTARDEYDGSINIGVFLDANENPYNNGYNRYPDPHCKELKEKLAIIKNCQPENIFIGNGSDEAIDLLYRIFCEPGKDNVVMISPSYGMYKVAASINNVEVREIQLDKDFDFCVDAMLSACDGNTKLMFICSPNNPSGNLLNRDKVKSLIEKFKGILVIDEAYIDFAEEDGFLNDINSYNNLVILQTLSKAWGMAGVRFGLSFSNEEIISYMNRVKYPYNINVLSQRLILQELDKYEVILKQVEEIKQQRSIVIEQLKSFDVINKVYPSDANFVLAKINGDATKLYNYLVTNGVIVRNRSGIKGCENSLRITIGTKEENENLINLLNHYS